MTLIREKASSLTIGYGGWTNPTPTFFRVFMPYVIQRVHTPGHKHAFLPLNRDYLPLGLRRDGSVTYADYMPTHGVFFARDPAKFADVFWEPESGDQLWLYDDSPASRVDYFARLERLMSRQMDMVK
ncbi:hypothetical protein [Sphingomonas sp. T9W2]|uniref:hypothetical protein n=1 Tax=Sphingomonas sp. T9W2 TaxID=3143183 RepID=UPI0031F5A58E